MRILFVEDNATTARAAKVLLELRGYSVDTAECVADATHLLSVNKYDVLLSDLRLPDGSGYDVLAEIPQPIKAIAMSGFVSEADKAEAISRGFAAFLPKPYKTDDLVAIIESAELSPES